ncbi:MAG: hypothetical protein J0L93_10260 [Deltaproteobacteria bacterium]|nr:hypothetical protein [Deltaproteobacteria bacterium]
MALLFIFNFMKQQKKKIFQHENHKKPVTRRDFIAQGLMAGVGSILMPNIFSYLFKDVYAATPASCSNASMSNQIAFITLDLAGGYPMAQDFVPGGRGGQMDFLSSNIVSGIPANLKYGAIRNGAAIAPDTTYGVAMHPDSSFLAGLNAFLPSQFRNSVDGFILCGTSNDDTSINAHNAGYLVSAAGRSGQLLPSIGTEGSLSGGNASAAVGSEVSAYRPIRVANRRGAQSIVDRGGLIDALGAARMQKIRTATAQMSSAKLRDFRNMNLTQQIDELVQCGYINADSLLSNFQPTQIFPNDPISSTDDLAVAYATTNLANNASAVVTRLVMQNFSGVGTITLGGYDSHDNTATETRQKGFQAGAEVGKMLHYAARIGKPLFIHVITDGGMGTSAADTSVSNLGNAQNPTFGGDGFLSRPGDNGAASVCAVFSYIPGATRGAQVQNSGRQVGAFTTSGVDISYLITANNSPTNMAKAVALNYLALSGRESELKSLPGGNGSDPFEGANYSKYLIFKKAT